MLLWASRTLGSEGSPIPPRWGATYKNPVKCPVSVNYYSQARISLSPPASTLFHHRKNTLHTPILSFRNVQPGGHIEGPTPDRTQETRRSRQQRHKIMESTWPTRSDVPCWEPRVTFESLTCVSHSSDQRASYFPNNTSPITDIPNGVRQTPVLLFHPTLTENAGIRLSRVNSELLDNNQLPRSSFFGNGTLCTDVYEQSSLFPPSLC